MTVCFRLLACFACCQVSEGLRRRFPEECWSKLHLQIIFMGREHCPAKNHDPHLCPVCCWVKAKANNDDDDDDDDNYDDRKVKSGASSSSQASKKSSSSSYSHPPSPSSLSAAADAAARASAAANALGQNNSPKKHKGVIFYADRKTELAGSPHLVADRDTPSAAANASASTAANVAANANANTNANAAASDTGGTKRRRKGLF